MIQSEMNPCAHCGKVTVHLVKRPNHILHLLLTALTLGLWAVVWLLLVVVGGEGHCTVCGRRS